MSPAALALLRDELGFGGLIVSDALDMRAIAGTVGVQEGAVRALAAGVDALCLGPAVGPAAIEGVRDAVVAAVRAGRIAEERLAEAAARVDSAVPAPVVAALDGAVGPEAARRAVRVRGDVAIGAGATAVELLPEPLMAVGETGASFGRELRARVPDASVVAIRGEAELDSVRLGGGRLVVVVRDLARHPWQQRIAARLLERRPDAVLVETGVPGWVPPGATAVVETYGGGRASLTAAVELLAPAAERV
jgi:beta-N-acetylhexosaminidase